MREGPGVSAGSILFLVVVGVHWTRHGAKPIHDRVFTLARLLDSNTDRVIRELFIPEAVFEVAVLRLSEWKEAMRQMGSSSTFREIFKTIKGVTWRVPALQF